MFILPFNIKGDPGETEQEMSDGPFALSDWSFPVWIPAPEAAEKNAFAEKLKRDHFRQGTAAERINVTPYDRGQDLFSEYRADRTSGPKITRELKILYKNPWEIYHTSENHRWVWVTCLEIKKNFLRPCIFTGMVFAGHYSLNIFSPNIWNRSTDSVKRTMEWPLKAGPNSGSCFQHSLTCFW